VCVCESGYVNSFFQTRFTNVFTVASFNRRANTWHFINY